MAGLLGRGEDAGGRQPHSSTAAVLGEMRSRSLGTICTHQSCLVVTKQSRWWLVCRGRDSCQVKKELSDPEAWEQVNREAWHSRHWCHSFLLSSFTVRCEELGFWSQIAWV